MHNCKISILTPSLNNSKFIEKNILSVLNQNYLNFEHIIIDGGSTDGTVEILKKYNHLIWVSEKDKGQADALNKALFLAKGDVIGWLNSDDYYEKNIFQEIASCFKNNQTAWVIGSLNEDNLILHSKKETVFSTITFENLIANPDIVKQPCTFYRKSVLDHVKGWDEKLQMVMDLDLWLKISKQFQPVMINKTLANFVIHDNQKTSTNNIIKQLKEIIYVLEKHNINNSTVIKVKRKKILSYLKQKAKQFLKIK